MQKNKKRLIVISFILAIIVSAISYGVYWGFYDIQRIDGQKYITELTSADGRYTVTTYLNNGGATTGYSVLGIVKNNISNKTKNIYWKYNCDKANMEWLSNDTIKINGVKLQVEEEVYDYRRR